jgi:hypothetical protein
MKYLRYGPVIAFLFFSAVYPGTARAQLFGAGGLDPRFCDQPNFRQTVVYIDDMIMVDGRTEWATKLADKLRATLAPGERVTVVRLSPANGQSSELWSGCWPDYGDAKRAILSKESYFFSRSPLAQLDEQRKFFLQGFGGALTTVYTSAKRPAANARFSANSPPGKQILRALASDEGRFANSKITIRAIIYSDMAENSDLGSVFKGPLETAPNYGQKLGSYLRRGVFYDFGVGGDVNDDSSFQETARAFWSAAIRSMAATVGGIGADLNVPNTLPIKSYDYSVTLNFDGQELDGRMSLLTNAEGDLVDSWIGISRLSSALLTGTFHCTNGGDDLACRLDANTSSGITTTSPSELVTLEGTDKTGLKGRLGVKGSTALFDLTAVHADQ